MTIHKINVSAKFYEHAINNKLCFIKCQLPMTLAIGDKVSFSHTENGCICMIDRRVYCFHLIGKISDSIGLFSVGTEKIN